jgi:hypothetical protein
LEASSHGACPDQQDLSHDLDGLLFGVSTAAALIAHFAVGFRAGLGGIAVPLGDGHPRQGK